MTKMYMNHYSLYFGKTESATFHTNNNQLTVRNGWRLFWRTLFSVSVWATSSWNALNNTRLIQSNNSCRFVLDSWGKWWHQSGFVDLMLYRYLNINILSCSN